MKGEILKLLKETAGYISGQELCEKFGVSRTAVWKVINQLKEEGYEIEAANNRGYCLPQTNDLLNEEGISLYLNERASGYPLEVYKILDSTNTWPEFLFACKNRDLYEHPCASGV